MFSAVTPAPVIPGSQLGSGFFAHLITSRFCDHLPYYRQAQIYAREGVVIPDKSLSNYAQIIGRLLEPAAKKIKRELLSQNYLQADETRLEILEKEKPFRGQLWVLNGPHTSMSYYEYHQSRDAQAAAALLGEYAGALQTDQYSAYQSFSGASLGCMAHARRYFVKANKIAPKEAKHAVKLISALYGIEKQLSRERIKFRADAWYEHRLTVREEKAVPVLAELKAYLLKIKDKYLIENHPMAVAISYMLKRFDKFCAYTTNGRFQIDNNDIERIIRPVAIGRNNWLFAGSHEAAAINAVMMTVVQTCKRLKINPQEYLASVLPHLADIKTISLEGLTPMDWKKSK